MSRKSINPKVSAGALGGALAVLVCAVLDAFGVRLDPPVASALATVFGFVAGYLRPVE
jgi:hypothetical protein